MKVEAWVVVKATRNGFMKYPPGTPFAGQPKIDRLRLHRVAQNKPATSEDEIAFKVEFDVDEAWFLEGTARITASIPAPPPDLNDIPASVDLPVKPRAKSAAAAVLNP